MLKKSACSASRISSDSRRRYLDHHAYWNWRDRNSTASEGLGGADHGRTSRAQLLHARDERKHDSQRAVRGRAQQRTQLRLEDLVHGQAQAHAAEAERRPRALGSRMLKRQLRLADVERANRHAARGHALDQACVCVELGLFGECGVPAPREQELRPEESYSVRARFARPDCIIR